MRELFALDVQSFSYAGVDAAGHRREDRADCLRRIVLSFSGRLSVIVAIPSEIS
jgi:hypothetical protein